MIFRPVLADKVRKHRDLSVCFSTSGLLGRGINPGVRAAGASPSRRSASLLDEAIRALSMLIQKDPARPDFRVLRSLLYGRTGQDDFVQQDLASLDEGRQFELAHAWYYYWRGEPEKVRQHHNALLAFEYAHPAAFFYTHCMIDDLDGGFEFYEKATFSESGSFIDFGNMRASTRAFLPMSLVIEIEKHPRFQVLLEREGVDQAWCNELLERVNAIVDTTGIRVKNDEDYEGLSL